MCIVGWVGLFSSQSLAQNGSSLSSFYGQSPRAFEPSERPFPKIEPDIVPFGEPRLSRNQADSSKVLARNRNGEPFISPASEDTEYWNSRVCELDQQSVLDLMPYLLLHSTNVAFHVPLIPPLFADQTYRISSGFGLRQHPVFGTLRRHAGIDLAGAMQPVKVTAIGVVERVAYESGYGLYILVNHGNTYQTLYGHLARAVVYEGQALQLGQPIGVLGSSGRVTGYHLHYEIRKNGQPLDPIRYLRSVSQFVKRYQQVIQQAISLGLGSRIIGENH